MSTDSGGVPVNRLASDCRLYTLLFKAGRSDIYYLPGNSPLLLKAGMKVVCEGDRGIDVGEIGQDHLYCVFRAVHIAYTSVNCKEVLVKRIERVATPADLAKTPIQRQDENRALDVCQSKAIERGLPMRILDAEFQWDRQKLIFTYQTDRRVDFRDLVRDLYKTFKARIWLKEEPNPHIPR
ncbi:PSP1 C-terminal conserved region-domain-containing protein [Dimargaris cristalligena]|uniref:PSP1 C-terminal conserved region-domain-containing protein n=1 Tax=Dimargaris cristalligena TaxID=215637 RepID=A0A4P9ZYS0_9FUNG|nr:PSP1 C-terminal conserved region-domain-containing protein [Dimargaris cristalligena]|eukprot:RKP38221.1 PSP1 C-terminal conserved region-domain-containing protein [Dimargaris cristalligena]